MPRRADQEGSAILLNCELAKLRRWYRQKTGIRAQVGPIPALLPSMFEHFAREMPGYHLLKDLNYNPRKSAEDYFMYKLETVQDRPELFGVYFALCPITPERLAFCKSISDALTSADDDELDVFTASSLMDSDEVDVPFSDDEKAFVRMELARAKQEIQTKFALNMSQFRDVESKLDYLIRKVDDLGKFTWKRLFVAILVAIAVDLFKSTAIPTSLLDTFRNLITRFYDTLKLLLGGS